MVKFQRSFNFCSPAITFVFGFLRSSLALSFLLDSLLSQELLVENLATLFSLLRRLVFKRLAFDDRWAFLFASLLALEDSSRLLFFISILRNLALIALALTSSIGSELSSPVHHPLSEEEVDKTNGDVQNHAGNKDEHSS